MPYEIRDFFSSHFRIFLQSITKTEKAQQYSITTNMVTNNCQTDNVYKKRNHLLASKYNNYNIITAVVVMAIIIDNMQMPIIRLLVV